MPASLLVVCTGNVCRSPVAEHLLRAGVGALGGVSVASAGTSALSGRGVEEQFAARLREHGIEPFQHSARQLTASMVSSADLILVSAREHSQSVVPLYPRANRVIVPLRQAGRIAAEITDVELSESVTSTTAEGKIADAIGLLLSLRGVAGRTQDSGEDDIVDPYRAPVFVADAALDEIGQATRSLGELFQRAAYFGVAQR